MFGLDLYVDSYVRESFLPVFPILFSLLSTDVISLVLSFLFLSLSLSLSLSLTTFFSCYFPLSLSLPISFSLSLLGIDVSECVVTRKEVGVTIHISDSGASWGSIENSDTLIEGKIKEIKKLIWIKTGKKKFSIARTYFMILSPSKDIYYIFYNIF